jgi:hypothetical protein
LAQNAEQPELEGQGLVEAIPADQTAVPTVATHAVSLLRGLASSSYAVNQLLGRQPNGLILVNRTASGVTTSL